MLPDSAMFWGKQQGYKCLPVRPIWLFPLLPYLVLLLLSDRSECLLCTGNCLDTEMYSSFSLSCIQKVAYQIRLLFPSPETCLNPLLTICVSLSLSSAGAANSQLPILLTHSFCKVHFYSCSSDHALPQTLIFLPFSSILASLFSEKHQQRVWMHWNKSKAAAQFSFTYKYPDQ